MTPIRCAVLGTGHSHALGKLNVLRNFPEWELVGVCEPDAAWRQQRQQEANWQGLRWLEESEVFDDPTIQMIAVESEVPQLLPLGQKAIDAGKHIHLDKPAGTDLAVWRALLAKAEQQDLIIQMGYMFRYNPGFDLVRQAVREGWLGDVHYVRGGINSASDPATKGTAATLSRRHHARTGLPPARHDYANHGPTGEGHALLAPGRAV